jgi:hypothetical protein
MTSASLDVGEGTAIVVAVRTLALSRERVTKETFLRRAVQALVPGSDVGVHLANTIATGVESALVIRVFIDIFDHIDLKGIIGIRFGCSEKMVVTSPPFGQF